MGCRWSGREVHRQPALAKAGLVAVVVFFFPPSLGEMAGRTMEGAGDHGNEATF